MNWLQSRSLLLILLILLVFACKRGDNDIAGEIQPKTEELSSFYTEDIAVKTTMVYYDSIITSNTYRLLVGQYNDNELGKVTCNAYTELGLYSAFSGFGPNPVVDTVYLMISYSTAGIPQIDPNATIDPTIQNSYTTNSYFYGTDINTPQQFSIHRLTKDIHDNVNGDNTYPKYKMDEVAYDPVPLATFETNVDSTSQIIFLDPKLGNEIILSSDSLMTTTGLQNIFKGLAILATPGNTVVRGIEQIDMVIKYHNFYGTNNLRTREVFVFGANINYNGIFNSHNAFNHISVDRSASRLSNLKNPYDSVSFEESDKKCYVQSNTGLFTKVEFPNLKAFKDSFPDKKILINRAELIIKPSLEDTVNFRIPLSLYAYELKNDRRIKKIGSAVDSIGQTLQNELNGNIFTYTSPLSAPYNISKKYYRFPVTSYMQSLIDGRKDNYGLLIGASTDVFSSQGFAAPYAVLSKMSFYNDKDRPSNISMKIYYTTY